MEKDISKQERIQNLSMYNFLFSPGMGMLRQVSRFDILAELDVDGKTKKYFLVPKIEQIDSGEEEKKQEEPKLTIEIKKIKKPFLEHNKLFFLLKATFIPVIVTLFPILVGINIIAKSSGVAYDILAVLYFLTFIYFGISIKKAISGTANIKKEAETDFKIILSLLVLFVLALLYTLVYKGSFQYPVLAVLVMNMIGVMVFLEMIKKAAFIIFSKNNQFWEYYINSSGMKFWLITPKRRGQ